jgi:hypothetical protein
VSDIENSEIPAPIFHPSIEQNSAISLYVESSPQELAAKLFALSVDLETVLERKKERFRSEIFAFVEDVQKKKQNITFEPKTVSNSIDEDQRVGGVYSFVLGFFGYERRVRKTRLEYSKALSTKEIAIQTEKFISDARRDLEGKIHSLFDVDATVRECTHLAAERLQNEETAILKVALRRSLNKMTVKQLQLRSPSARAHTVLTDPAEIEAASQSAYKNIDQLCRIFVSKANAARKSVDQGMEKILDTLKEELVAACFDRKHMEQILHRAMQHEKTMSLETGVRQALTSGEIPQVVTPLGSEDWRRALLTSPS